MSAETPSAPTATHAGACHCGNVTYTGAFDLTSGHIIKCNCTICHKKGYFLLSPTSDASFSLLTPSSTSELLDYQFAKKRVHHYSCPKCATSVFISGFFEMGDKELPFMAVMGNTLEKRLDGEPLEDLRKVKIKYMDGKADKLEFQDEPWEGGAW